MWKRMRRRKPADSATRERRRLRWLIATPTIVMTGLILVGFVWLHHELRMVARALSSEAGWSYQQAKENHDALDSLHERIEEISGAIEEIDFDLQAVVNPEEYRRRLRAKIESQRLGEAMRESWERGRANWVKEYESLVEQAGPR